MSFRAFSLCLINFSLSLYFSPDPLSIHSIEEIFFPLFPFFVPSILLLKPFIYRFDERNIFSRTFLFFVPSLYPFRPPHRLVFLFFYPFFRDSVIIWFSFYFRCFVCSTTLNGVKEYEEGLLLFNFTHFASFYG